MNKMSAVLASLLLAVGVTSVKADDSGVQAQVIGNANVQGGNGIFIGNIIGISGTNSWSGSTFNQLSGSTNGNVVGLLGQIAGGARAETSSTVSPHSASSASNASTGSGVFVIAGHGTVNTNANADSNAQSHPFFWH